MDVKAHLCSLWNQLAPAKYLLTVEGSKQADEFFSVMDSVGIQRDDVNIVRAPRAKKKSQQSREIFGNHWFLTKHAIENYNGKNILVFEDDCKPVQGCESFLIYLLETLIANQGKWKLMNFGQLAMGPVYSTKFKGIVESTFPLSAHAYLLNGNTAKELFDIIPANKWKIPYAVEALTLLSVKDKWAADPIVLTQSKLPRSMQNLPIFKDHSYEQVANCANRAMMWLYWTFIAVVIVLVIVFAAALVAFLCGKLLKFKGHPEFRPNLTPEEILENGSFGGGYFRDIYSAIVKKPFSGDHKEFPDEWFDGLDIDKMITSSTYRKQINKYGVKCGSSLEMWERSGWIRRQDPRGWFQWYCRFYEGRRSKDDDRQIKRWMGVCGENGRWKKNLINQCKHKGAKFNDYSVSPVIRQVLMHWAFELSAYDLK